MSPTVRVDRDELEREFQKETQTRLARDTRWGVLHTLYMYPLFIPLDLLVYPNQAMTFMWIRLAVVLLSIAVHFAMRLPFAERLARLFASFVYLYCTLSIVVMVHLVDGYASPYYAGINLVLIAFMFIAPMRLRETILVCLVVYAAYITPILIQGNISDYAVLVTNNFFLLSTMVLVSVSSFIATTMRKKEFSSRYELACANDELTKLDVLKSQFFASISHEIRTPLTSIMAPTDSLYRGDVGELTDAQRELVAQVNRNALRLLDLINQMLDFAKFDAKKMTLHLRRVSMPRVIRNQIGLFREVCNRKGLEMQSDVDADIPTVFLDADKVDRILSNLIRNAIKFTDDGSITVRARLEREASDQISIGRGRAAPGSWITFAVQDTGIGIAPEDTARVFQRFQQVDGSSTRKYEGTGLGLAIVQESVELQHGEISVQSAEGVGTTFTVRLPVNLDELEPTAFIDRRQLDRRQDEGSFSGPDRRVGPRRTQDFGRLTLEDVAQIELDSVSRAAESREHRESEGEAPESGISILYVEDNTDLRTYIARMLRSFGHRVETAEDGTIGWQKAQELRFDMVVSDVMMPGIDGFELARLIKADTETRKIPVILITAKSDTDARIEGLELGADDYIAKPVNVRELDARVRNIVADRKFREAVTRAEELESRVHELAVGFSESLELRDGYTAGHSDDVLSYGTMIANGLGIPMNETMRESLLLHDIGKIGIPDAILHKPAPLSPEEWTVMRRHSELGADLLTRFDSLAPVARIVRAHHERYDGSGYPQGLRGEEIPLEARLIAVADAWHAMMEDRTYRKALQVDDAVSELIRNRGRQFDPRAVDALLEGLIRADRIDEELVSTQLANARSF